ncbi:MAG: NAD-dependent epimerase/dehydratase family protein [Gammaproteobacteria bacterium]|jgi:nucleoside-diphosphate-sugar epimerase|nr:NAD-dependent epimerase/dehydratase family protein [Gammaproteobacteria bacterium]MBT4494131.1 NAD-dependent epimerase/dehydratase family protein [Gammaproteobacteria bacterium]MBT7369915.1 NAD-dependent epimerase/dehydratase family protein [Gammaproteobacteria bacterium]
MFFQPALRQAARDRYAATVLEEEVMAPVPKGSTIAVTGSAGFIGGWVVKLLLEKGYRVRACVRDVEDENKVGFLKSMGGYASGRLTLHTADLDDPGCFDEIFKGCHGVCHVSHVSDYQDQDYIQGVCDHIVDSINKSEWVNRIVVTSSLAAIIAEGDIHELVRRPVIFEDREPIEDHPKRTPERGQGYSLGKVLAQHAFSDAAELSGRWDAITCCPSDNVGPILSSHQKEGGPWQHNIEMMLTGKYYQTDAYRPWMTVDVRDTAAVHVGLLEHAEVSNGERYLSWSTERSNVEDVCADIDRLLPELQFDAPDVTDPFPERIQAREEELRGIWAQCELRNDRVRNLLDMDFIPLDKSVRDCVESLITVGGVVPRVRQP